MIGAFLFGIIVAVIVSMAIGYFWYGPSAFGKAWMQTQPKGKKGDPKDMKKALVQQGIMTLIAALVLGSIMLLLNTRGVMDAITLAFLLWLGFIFPVQYTTMIFTHKNRNLLLIDTGYQLVSYAAMAATLSFF